MRHTARQTRENRTITVDFRTSRTHSHKPLNLLITLFIGHIDLKNN
jgi:hypothetical protein